MDSRLSAEEPLHLLKVHYFPSLQLSFRMTGAAAAAAGWVKKHRGAAGRQGDGVTTQDTSSLTESCYRAKTCANGIKATVFKRARGLSFQMILTEFKITVTQLEGPMVSVINGHGISRTVFGEKKEQF